MSLAEELLADLEDDSEEELEDELGEGSEAPRKDGVETEDGLGDAEMEVAAADTDQPSSGGGQTLEQVAKLYASAKVHITAYILATLQNGICNSKMFGALTTLSFFLTGILERRDKSYFEIPFSNSDVTNAGIVINED